MTSIQTLLSPFRHPVSGLTTLSNERQAQEVPKTQSARAFHQASALSPLLFTGNIHFSGKGYAPKQTELLFFQTVLAGLPQSRETIYAVSALPSATVKQALWQFVQGIAEKKLEPGDLPNPVEQAIPQHIQSEMARAKSRVMNFHALEYGGKFPLSLKTTEAYQGDVAKFQSDLNREMQDTLYVLRHRFKFSDPALHLFKQFTAQVVPVLFNLGFPDALPHAFQVARLAVAKAYEKGATEAELLQAAMVGIAHDPKKPKEVKINLAAHPIVASAIAHMALNDDTVFMRDHLENFLQGKELTVETFTQGVVEALSVNNDSRFVNKFVIWPGILGQVQKEYGLMVRKALEDEVIKRFNAPSQERGTVRPISDHLEGNLHDIRLDSGLHGIRRGEWDGFVEKNKPAGSTLTGESLFESAIAGSPSPEELALLQTIQKTRFEDADMMVFRAPVRATSLLSHHEEVTSSGRAAARALVEADSLLLSPHKVFLAHFVPSDPVPKRIASFIVSFNDNINDLPFDSQASARPWQRAVYISILRAAGALTQRNLVKEFMGQHGTEPIEQQITTLSNLLIAPDTWNSGTSQYASHVPKPADDNDPAFLALEKAYLAMTKEFRFAVFQRNGSEQVIGQND
ncbi:MAG: hypothetical protein K2X01_02600 [Cyanobacteria bacterium]|nr:hypothetical protein [Cyanobacteriota bacterium]